MRILDKPQSITQVVKTGVSLWKHTLKLTFPLAIIIIFILLGLHFILPVESLQSSPGTQPPPLSIHKAGILIGYGIVAFITFIITHAAIIMRINQAMEGQHLALGKAIGFGLQKIIPLALVIILVFSIVITGYILLIIPGIILSVYFMFSSYIVIIEGKGALASVKESYRLVSGNWCHTAGAFFLIGVIYCIFSFIFNLIGIGVDIFSLMITKILFGHVGSAPTYVAFLVSGMIASILYSFYYAGMMAIYYDLRVKKGLVPVPPTNTPA